MNYGKCKLCGKGMTDGDTLNKWKDTGICNACSILEAEIKEKARKTHEAIQKDGKYEDKDEIIH